MQDLVGLVISTLLLGDFSLVLLTLLQLYSFSLADVFLVLLILPLGILIPFPTGINALFSHGPRRSAGIARMYALWNISSLINTVSCSFFRSVPVWHFSLYQRVPSFTPLKIPKTNYIIKICYVVHNLLYEWLTEISNQKFKISICE